MSESIRRCRPVLRRSRAHALDAYELALAIYRNKMLATDAGLVSYRLTRELLSEAMLENAVAFGVASKFVDPETGQCLYAYIERG